LRPADRHAGLRRASGQRNRLDPANDPSVFAFSIHGARNFLFRKEADDLCRTGCLTVAIVMAWRLCREHRRRRGH